MDRSNKYEAAFEAYLQWHRLAYVAIDESRRCYLDNAPVKNLDFIVYGECGSRLLVDVKGRRYPAGPPERPRRVWECWARDEDIDGLLRWQEQFGSGFQSLLVFTYQLDPSCDVSTLSGDLWTWRGRRYLLRAILVEEYQREMKPRSPKWGTVTLPTSVYRRLIHPFHYFTRDVLPEPSDEECPF
jgi:hypothetical protein